MVIRQTDGCCAISEIVKLSTHRTPLSALEAFCKQYRGVRGGVNLHTDQMSAYYLFSGVVEERGTGDNYDIIAGRVDDIEYGPKFAAYILKHDLGTVVQCPKRINDNHPLHTVQCWVWCPDKKKVADWWKERVQSGYAR